MRIKIFDEHSPQPKIYPVRTSTFSIGRDPTNDLVVEDPSVSRFHCKLTALEGGQWKLENLSSRHGILRNRSKQTALTIAPGETVEVFLGGVAVAFEADTSASDVTREVDVMQMRSHFSGESANRSWRVLGPALVLSYVVFALEQWLSYWLSPEVLDPAKIFLSALSCMVVVFGLAFLVSLACRMVRGEYRFLQMFWIIAAAALVIRGRDIFFLAVGQVLDTRFQGGVEILSVAALTIAVSAAIMKQILSHAKWIPALLSTAIGVGFVFMIPLIAQRMEKSYKDEADGTPEVAYPLFTATAGTEDLLKAISAEKGAMEEEREEMLKLR